ncbi:hypothetical protein HPP92_022311 [Vanilla planifolia]|uniref:Uncharacterized protein n=1 Tax=Vanilla planifolia TaxID=51239 RepID=A0A835PY01_VANPL|nr:hypothetical protein HPP92_022311 [Vanilla planifolia]
MKMFCESMRGPGCVKTTHDLQLEVSKFSKCIGDLRNAIWSFLVLEYTSLNKHRNDMSTHTMICKVYIVTKRLVQVTYGVTFVIRFAKDVVVAKEIAKKTTCSSKN